MSRPNHHGTSSGSGSLPEEAPFESLPQSSSHASGYAPLVKTKSTPSLLAYRSGALPPPINTAKRLSIDAGQLDRMARSPILPEHEHGLGASGLRRIRQQPAQRAASSTSRPHQYRDTPPSLRPQPPRPQPLPLAKTSRASPPSRCTHSPLPRSRKTSSTTVRMS
ncbi:hypothetical protein P3342_003981 [Pyrenophora teres f. teres]|nr:hypothetical protein P3342_003981 [Pyrenophora teres f. teres]